MRSRSIGTYNTRTGVLRNAQEVTSYDAETIEKLKQQLQQNATDPWVVVDSSEPFATSLESMKSIHDPMTVETRRPFAVQYFRR